MRKLLSFFVLSFMVGLTLAAQNNQSLHLKGKVLDSTQLAMAATDVKVFKGTAKPKAGTEPFKSGQTNGNGDFDIEVPAGDYYIEISAPDFNVFSQAVKATANMQPLAVTLTVKTVETVIDVAAATNEVGVDPDSSLTTDVITGDALLDLPDNEEDLLAYLQELAAARGIIDGELNIRVDGFENSYLPNKNEIAEIRIVNTSFSADASSSGPRIEIVTRPGTGFWTGQLGFNFNDESLNAASPLTGRKPAAQTRNFSGQLRGPIIPGKVTATFNVQNNETDSEGNAIRAVGINGPVNEGVTSIRRTKTFRFSPNYTINKVHSLNGNFNYSKTDNKNSGIGGFNLPERASNTDGHNWTLQLTERATLSARLTNEFRMQVRQNVNQNAPVTNAMAINVADAFNGGGATNRNESKTWDYIFGNTVRWATTKNLQLTMAVEANYHKSHNDSQNNFLGTYNFASLADFCYAENFPGSECQQYQAIVNQALLDNVTPVYFNTAGNPIAITGVPTRFTVTQGNSVMDVHQAEFAAYIQGEWRLNPRTQLSFGTRYQIQQHLHDYDNIAPTAGLSYQLNTKQGWQTVVRAGARVNYQTYGMGNWETLLRNAGNFQTNYEVLNPVYPNPDLSTLVALASSTNTTQRIRAANYTAGYTIQPTFSVDQSLPKGHRLSFNFQINRGLHQTRNRNINAPFPGTPLDQSIIALLNFRCPFGSTISTCDQAAVRAQGRALVDAMRPDPTTGNISQAESSGKSLAKNFSIQYRVSNKRILGNRVQIGGTVSWNMNWAQDDNGTPMNNYDIASEWGRSQNDQRHRITGSLNIAVPWNLRFTFNQLGWQSGRPYNITTGTDLNGDGSNNDRPAGFVRNSGTGPDTFNPINLTVSKIIPLGGGRPVSRPANDYAEPQRGGGGFGGGGGGERSVQRRIIC